MKGEVNLRVSEREVASVVDGFSDDRAENLDLFARAAWSHICEPGDGFAGSLVSVLGAARALQLLIEGLEPLAVDVALREVGYSLQTLPGFDKGEQYVLDSKQRWQPRLNASSVRASFEYLRSVGGNVHSPGLSGWGSGLDDLGTHSPFVLWVRGKPELLSRQNSISIVGSRGVTDYGRRVTADLTLAAAEQGAVVVSGGALGVDAIAHQTALTQRPGTIAVLAGGVDRLYPSANQQLLQRIASVGALVSEVPPGVAPSKWRFLQRNRLIAALGVGTLVTEANFRSGALSTARHAVALGRQVWAVPGPIDSPKSAGCNRLIEDGLASLISGPEGLNGIFSSQEGLLELAEINGFGALETRVYDAVGFGEESLDTICVEAGLTRSEAKFALVQLELAGLVERRGTDWRRAN